MTGTSFALLFRGEISAFFSDGAFHHRYKKGEQDRERRKDQEGVEIRKGRGLLLAQVLQGLPGHLLRAGRISGLLQEPLLSLRNVGIHSRVQRIKILVQSQGVEYLAAPGGV